MAANYAAWATHVDVQSWPMPETPKGEQDGSM